MPQRPADPPDVHGTRGQPGDPVHGPMGFGRARSLRLQPLEANPTLFTVPGRPTEAQPDRIPEPEEVKKLGAPAAKRAPTLLFHRDAEVGTDIRFPLRLHKMKPERPEDHRRCIPPPGQKEIRKEADRVPAPLAQEPANQDVDVPMFRKSKNLP